MSGLSAAVAGLMTTDGGEAHVLTLPGPQAGAWELMVYAILAAIAESTHLTYLPGRREDAVTKLSRAVRSARSHVSRFIEIRRTRTDEPSLSQAGLS